MAKAAEAGKAFLESVLAAATGLTAEQKAAMLADPTVLERIGDGTLMRAEASRIADELKTRGTRILEIETEQKAWWDTNKAKIGRLEELEKNPPAPNGTATGIDRKTFDEELARATGEIEQSGLYITAVAAEIAAGHLHEFNERLNMRDLFAAAVKAKRPLDEYYNSTVAERRATRSTEARAKELADAKEAGRKEGLAQALNQTAAPYPVSGSQGPSTLSGLRKPTDAKPDEYSLEAAVRTATEVMATAG